jgi:hypothetical protein
MSTERAFFPVMEEFGFFSHIYEKLPADFTAIFEIARVLEDEMSQLSQKLETVFKLPVPMADKRMDKAEDFHRYTPAGDRYAADLITSYHDVARVYPNQFLLPDEIFLQRLALRELWMPVSKHGVILPVDDTKEGFTFDSRKQKVYVLFDTSRSMSAHHRIHLAKAILYIFLKRNKTDLGHISFRTFDDHVGDLHTAVDQESYEALMRLVLRITHLGEATVLQKALFQALDDIQEMEHLSGAEILIITDGAVSLDEETIREKMDENIEIHTVKIGHAQVFASEAQIADMVARGQIKDRALIELQTQKAEIEHQLRVIEGSARRQSLEQMLNGVRRQIASHNVPFGHELENISTVYVNIDDFNETERFLADHETIDDLEALARALEEEGKEFLTPELTKKLAVLHDHIQFLQKFEKDESLRERLKSIDDHLRGLLSQFLGTPPESGTNAPEAGTEPARLPMSEDDTRDMKFLLEADLSIGKSWGVLLKWIWEMAKQLRGKLRKR